MATSTNDNFLSSTKRQFLYYKSLGEKAIEQLKPEQLFIQLNTDSNSIAIIVQHLHGNMLSRWTDFLTSDGEKEWRNRDTEFDTIISTKEDLLTKWNEGWDCLLKAINSLTPTDLDKIIYIRNEGHTVIEAINRQLSHYPYHVGQIIFLSKVLKQGNWESLSIPKNKSQDYNATKFSDDKGIRHFTDKA